MHCIETALQYNAPLLEIHFAGYASEAIYICCTSVCCDIDRFIILAVQCCAAVGVIVQCRRVMTGMDYRYCRLPGHTSR